MKKNALKTPFGCIEVAKAILLPEPVLSVRKFQPH